MGVTEGGADGFNLEGSRGTGGNKGRDKVSVSVEQEVILKALVIGGPVGGARGAAPGEGRMEYEGNKVNFV